MRRHQSPRLASADATLYPRALAPREAASSQLRRHRVSRQIATAFRPWYQSPI